MKINTQKSKYCHFDAEEIFLPFLWSFQKGGSNYATPGDIFSLTRIRKSPASCTPINRIGSMLVSRNSQPIKNICANQSTYGRQGLSEYVWEKTTPTPVALRAILSSLT